MAVTAPPPAVSVIVPAFRAADHLGRCLEALTTQDAPGGAWEVVVVDDASPDDTAAIAARHPVRLVRLSENRGAAAARNAGAAVARGSMLLFVDSDVVAAPGLVRAAAALLDAGVEAATGRYDAEPANATRFARYKALWTWHAWERTAASTGQSGHLQGALCCVRADRFAAVGGFDERFRGGSVEDYELSLRLRAAGLTIAFDDGLRGRHHFPGWQAVARNWWDRARMWRRLPQRGFSSGQASGRSAVAAACALGGATARAVPPLWPIAPLCDAGFLWASAPFLRLAAERGGPAFAVYCAGVHWSLCVVVGAAAASARFGTGSWDGPGGPAPGGATPRAQRG